MTRSTRMLSTLFGTLALSACSGEIAAVSAPYDAGPEASSSSSSGSGEAVPPSSSSSSGSSSGGPVVSGSCAIPAGAPHDSAAKPVVLAHVSSAAGIAVDGTSAYVASYEIGPVYRVALDGSGVTTLHSLSATNVAINSTTVYTVSPSGGSAPQGLVVGCAKAGCNGQYTTLATGQNDVWGVAADDVNVYWTNQAPGGSVMTAPIGGGPATPLSAAGAANSIVAVGGRVIYTGTNGASGTEGMLSIPTTGGSPTVLVPPGGNTGVFALAADCTNAYYQLNDGTIGQVPVGGGTPTVLTKGSQGYGLQMAVDAESGYFIDGQGIKAIPIGGGAVTTLATGVNPGALAVDATRVYWTNLGDGTLMAIAK